MAAMFPTERSGVPMFGMDTAVDKAAARRQPAGTDSEDAAAAVLSDPVYQQFVGGPRTKLEKAQREYGSFEGELAANKAERESTQLGRRQEAFDTYAESVKAPELRAERTRLEEQAGEAFVPTQENVRDMATIFSLVGVLGFAIGAGGKSNAIGAMNAMNGMMEGYKQGRQDRYLREKDLFEANTKALKTKIDALNNRMVDIAKLAAVDMEKANMEADMLFAQEGADFLKQYKDKVGLVNTIKMLQEQVKGGQELFKFIQTEKLRAADKQAQRQFMERMQEDRQQAARDLKYLAFSLKDGGGAGKPMKEKDTVQLEGLYSLADQLRQLEKEFKDEYASLGVLGVGADLSLEAKRRFGDKEGEKAAQWWSKYQRLQAPNRHALFGATLTGNELKNYQSFTAKTSDAPSFVRTMLQDQADYSEGTAQSRVRAFEQTGYKVPELGKPRNFLGTYGSGGGGGGETVTVGGQTYSRPSSFTDQQWADYKRSVGAQ